VVLDKNELAGDAVGFALKDCGVRGVMKDVGEQHQVEGLVGKGNASAIEDLHRDVRAVAGKDVDADDFHVGALGGG
jgi:hypothetical protein